MLLPNFIHFCLLRQNPLLIIPNTTTAKYILFLFRYEKFATFITSDEVEDPGAYLRIHTKLRVWHARARPSVRTSLSESPAIAFEAV